MYISVPSVPTRMTTHTSVGNMTSNYSNREVTLWCHVLTTMAQGFGVKSQQKWRQLTSRYDVTLQDQVMTSIISPSSIPILSGVVELGSNVSPSNSKTHPSKFSLFSTQNFFRVSRRFFVWKKNKEHRKCSIFLSKEYITQEYRMSLYFLNVLNLQNRTTVRFSTFVNSLKALFCFQLNKTLKLWNPTAYANKYKKQTGQKISREERIKCHFQPV